MPDSQQQIVLIMAIPRPTDDQIQAMMRGLSDLKRQTQMVEWPDDFAILAEPHASRVLDIVREVGESRDTAGV